VVDCNKILNKKMLRRTPRQRSPRVFSVTPPILLPPSFRVVLVPSTPDARVDRGTWRAACREKEMQPGCRRCLCRRQDQSSRIPTGPETCRFLCATARRRPTARASPWPNRRLPLRSQCPSKTADVSFLTPSGMSSLLKNVRLTPHSSWTLESNAERLASPAHRAR
jgi:hypothetical protein